MTKKKFEPFLTRRNTWWVWTFITKKSITLLIISRNVIIGYFMNTMHVRYQVGFSFSFVATSFYRAGKSRFFSTLESQVSIPILGMSIDLRALWARKPTWKSNICNGVTWDYTDWGYTTHHGTSDRPIWSSIIKLKPIKSYILWNFWLWIK